ncbi:MAG TPA: DNA-binding response regulator, partial [Firmicutes bacterium]|nr:DNA-binding response regulator [Bacillota bacterium]
SQRAGFNDQSYFSKVFRKLEGQSPLKWRTKHYA